MQYRLRVSAYKTEAILERIFGIMRLRDYNPKNLNIEEYSYGDRLVFYLDAFVTSPRSARQLQYQINKLHDVQHVEVEEISLARKRLIIFDTTLRDGEQTPGVNLNVSEKCEIAHALEQLGVDIIEAGFPIASQGDFDAVHKIASDMKEAVVAGMARALDKDIEVVAKALEPAKKKRIHIFLATSPLHREYKLRLTQEQILERIDSAVTYAGKYFDDIEFSAEDAVRTEHDYLIQVCKTAIDAGVTTLNFPDTVGYTVPKSYQQLIRFLKAHVENIRQAKISVHCHNDLGLAVANTLAALEVGADQIETTINGIGERAGNCSMEEVVMALKTRQDYYSLELGISTPRIKKVSSLVEKYTNVTLASNKPVVGRNVFAHASGVHQDGMMKHKGTYEIMRPEDIGITDPQGLVLGKLSGYHAFYAWVKKKGFSFEESLLKAAFQDFKRLMDKTKNYTEEDFIRFVEKKNKRG